MTIAKYTWKEYGVSLPDLKYRTLPQQVLQYEEEMYISRDYQYAGNKDNEANQPKS